MAGRRQRTKTGDTSRNGLVLLMLAVSAFLMTLDSSVMNVSIAAVANDLGTSVTGLQTAITMYTLVMASLMLVGGKLGTILGRRRAFAAGCMVYGLGSLVTALAPNLAVLLVGWSFLEGAGAALILPATVGLVAENTRPEKRSAAYGLVAAAAAIAVAVGPLIGGAVTTFSSWRWIFGAELVIVIVILGLVRMARSTRLPKRARLDGFGAVLSIIGLGASVFAILRSGEWGWVTPSAGAPSLLGISLVIWLLLAGGLFLFAFFYWETRVERKGNDPLLRPSLLGNKQLTGGLIMFFFQYMVQMGVFFTIPLFLSVVLELDALSTGLRILPLSLGLLLTAILIPRLLPRVSPRLIVRLGMAGLLAGTVTLVAGITPDAQAGVVVIPLLVIGLGMGALASQLGAATVSSVSESLGGEVGGLQNTATNLGASLGTALVGSVLIAALTTGAVNGIIASPVVPDSVKQEMNVHLTGSLPFISETDLAVALDKTTLAPDVMQEIARVNRQAQDRGLRTALSVVALFAVAAFFFTGRIPKRPPGAAEPESG